MAPILHRSAARRRGGPGELAGGDQRDQLARAGTDPDGTDAGRRAAGGRLGARPQRDRRGGGHKPHARRWRRAGQLRREVGRRGGHGDRPSRGPLINRLVIGLLRSPLSGIVDGMLLLLVIPGRRTGRAYTLPVQYASGPLYLWVWPGNPDAKTWWRNLRAPTVVTLRLRGTWVRGVARAIDGAVEPREVARGLAVYGARFPRTVRHVVGSEVTDQALRDAAATTVLVRIEVDDGILRATRRSTVPSVSGLPGILRRRPVPT